jgi:hypothetical protein
MSIGSVRDSLVYEVVDNRLMIRRAIKDNQGNDYDISIGFDDANFQMQFSPEIVYRCQALVQGCLAALQQQAAVHNKKVEKLEQLGFIVELPSAGKLCESHALVADVGQSVLDLIKKCPPRDYSSLKSIYLDQTANMLWRPEDVNKLEFITKVPGYSVHNGLSDFCDVLQESVLNCGSGVSPSSGDSSPDVPLDEKLPTPIPPNPPASSSPAIIAPPPIPLPESSKRKQSKDQMLKEIYDNWRAPHSMLCFWKAKKPALWGRIDFDQLRRKKRIPDPADEQAVRAAVQNGSPELQQLFAEWCNVAPAYYEAEPFRGLIGVDIRTIYSPDRLPAFYQQQLIDDAINPIKGLWTQP